MPRRPAFRRRCKGSEELLADADPDRAAERVDEAGLIAERRDARRVRHLKALVEQVIDPEAYPEAAHPRILAAHLGLAEIGEQAQVEGREARETQVVGDAALAVGSAAHGRSALPIGFGAKA